MGTTIDLIAEARQHRERLPLLGLYVYTENERAIRFYERMGFRQFHHTYRDHRTGATYQGMLLKLDTTQ
jgi:ribosomal protein S18 acetylase RimI-like enzyme